jgi:DNA-binding NtrC family response regulator
MGLLMLCIGMCQAIPPRTILVVEDEPFIRMFALATLQDAGFTVLQARNSAEALEILGRNGDISILLTDVRMPGAMDGLALVAQVHRDHPAIQSIVVSGNSSALAANAAGAMGYIAKPYVAQTMLNAVNDAILRN